MMLRDTRRQNRKCKRRGIFATKPRIKTAPEATQKRFFFTTNYLYDAVLWDLFRQP